MKKLFFALFTGALLFNSSVFAQSGLDIMTKCMAAIPKVKSVSYHFLAQERFKDGVIKKGDILFRVQESPTRRVYADATLPEKAQLIYEPAVSTKVRVNKGLKLSLSPTSSLLLKDQHHPIYKAGYGIIKKIVDKSLAAHKGEDLNQYVKLIGTVNYDGKDCWKVEINDPNYKIVNYTVKAGEDLWKIGAALAVPEYKIRELNGYIDYDDVDAGKVIKVPSSYAKKTTFYIEKTSYLPIYQKVDDDKGMYEIYEFKSMKLNPTFTDADFDWK